jgi:hypothetical protein
MKDKKDLRGPVKRYSRPELSVKRAAPPAPPKRKLRLEDVAAEMFGRTEALADMSNAPAKESDASGQPRKSETVVKGPAAKRRYRNLDLP